MATAEALPQVGYDKPADAAPAAPLASVTGLMSGIIDDAQTLLRQQAEIRSFMGDVHIGDGVFTGADTFQKVEPMVLGFVEGQLLRAKLHFQG